MKAEWGQFRFDETQIFCMAGGLANKKLIVPIRKWRRITAAAHEKTVEAFLDSWPVGIVEVIQDYQSILANQLSSYCQIGAGMGGCVRTVDTEKPNSTSSAAVKISAS
jgi:hypothetical protein